MAYSQGGLIEATDYNNLINGSNQLNTVWGVGTGDAGYGQTPITTVTSTSVVTASQWATLINTLNSVRTHQSGAGSGISAVTTGQTINHLSTLQANVNTSYTNRLTRNALGATTTGSNLDGTWNVATPTTFQQVRTVAFQSADQMRYFFNAGGRINLILTTVSGTDNAKETSWTNLLNNGVGTLSFDALTSQRSGTGYTLTTDGFSLGHWDMTGTDQTIFRLTDTTAAYTSNYVEVLANITGTAGSNGGKGTLITFTINYSDGAADNSYTTPAAFNPDLINMTMRTRIDVIRPATTNLTDVWGTITVAATVN